MLRPLNRYLVVEPIKNSQEDSNTPYKILIPNDVEINNLRFTLATLITTHPKSELETGIQLVMPTHVIEEVCFSDKKYYLVLENHVMGFFNES